jgi:hypothetical protein
LSVTGSSLDVAPWSFSAVGGTVWRRTELYIEIGSDTTNGFFTLQSLPTSGNTRVSLQIASSGVTFVTINGPPSAVFECPFNAPLARDQPHYVSLLMGTTQSGGSRTAVLGSVTIGTETFFCSPTSGGSVVPIPNNAIKFTIGQIDQGTYRFDEYVVREVGTGLTPPVLDLADCLCIQQPGFVPPTPSCPAPVAQAAPVSVTAPTTRTTGALLSGDEVAVCDFAGIGFAEVIVTVYDAKSTMSVPLRTGSIPVAPGLTDAVFCKASPDGTTLVVLTFNSLVTADPVTFAVEQSLLVGDDPRVLTVSDSFIYIVGISSVIRYDIAVLSTSSSNAAVVPQHVAVSATEDVYVLSNNGFSPSITRLSAGAFTSPPTASVSIPVTSWAGVAVLDDGSVFVTYAAGNRDVVFFAEIYDSTLSSMPLATFSVARSVDTDIISAPIAVGSKAVAYYTENGDNTAIYFDSVAQTVVAEVATTQYLGQFTTPSEWIDGNVADSRVFSSSGDGSAVVFGESTFGLIACENAFLDSEQ